MNAALIAAICLIPVSETAQQQITIDFVGEVPASLNAQAIEWVACSAWNSMDENRQAIPFAANQHQRPTITIAFANLGEQKAAQTGFNALFPMTPATVVVNSRGRWSMFGSPNSYSLHATIHHELFHLLKMRGQEADHRLMKAAGIPEFAKLGPFVVNQWR